MTILCYHAVDPDWTSPLSVTPGTFAEQMRWLSSHRDVVDPEFAAERIDNAGRLPRGTAAVTFDDGFESLLDNAVPALDRWRVPAIVFVVGKTLSNEPSPADWVLDPPPKPLATLSPAQLLELRERGVRLGSHSWSHADLTVLSEEECTRDLTLARESLEDILHRSVRSLAYPYGRHSAHVRRAARRAGFRHGFGLPESREPFGPHAIPRVGVYPQNGSLTLRIKTSQPYLAIRTAPAYRWARWLVDGRPSDRRV